MGLSKTIGCVTWVCCHCHVSGLQKSSISLNLFSEGKRYFVQQPKGNASILVENKLFQNLAASYPHITVVSKAAHAQLQEIKQRGPSVSIPKGLYPITYTKRSLSPASINLFSHVGFQPKNSQINLIVSSRSTCNANASPYITKHYFNPVPGYLG